MCWPAHIRALVPDDGVGRRGGQGGLRQHRGRPHRARPVAGRTAWTSPSRPTSSGRSSARRSAASEPIDPGRHLGRRPGAVHRAEAVHRQHRSRHHRLPRLRPGASASSATPWPTTRSGPRSRGCWPRPSSCWWPSTSSPDEAQQAYVDKILQRFANPYLPDTVDRVGRQPLRKLSRTERLIGPAAELAERGRPAASTCWPPSRRRCRSTSPRTRRASSCSSCWRPCRRPRRPSGSPG